MAPKWLSHTPLLVDGDGYALGCRPVSATRATLPVPGSYTAT